MKIHSKKLVPIVLILGTLFYLSFVQPLIAASWTTNGPLHTARYGHTATLLPNGMVIVVGGRDSNSVILASAQLYDPSTGIWTNTGSLNVARYDHTATLLTSGKLMVVGGIGAHAVSIVELYDPATGIWTTNSLTLNTARFRHTATLLSDGKVLVAGGGNGGFLSSAEVFDPATGAWTPTVNPLATGRVLHTATLLGNGKVLVAGGAGTNAGVPGIISSAELYDPASRMWTTINPMNLGRYRHTATLLPSGKVMVAGGAAVGAVTNSAEIYDPVAGTWTTINQMKSARIYHTANLLPNGTVLVTGGDAVGNAAEVYDLTTGTWTTTNAMKVIRQSHTATVLANGKVLVVGGTDPYYNPTASTEVYDYASGTWTNTGAMNVGHVCHSATLLPDGTVLVAGGGAISGITNSTEVYDYASGIWKAKTPMVIARENHKAALLSNGKLLIVGGEYGNNIGGGEYLDSNILLSSAEFYDPATNLWAMTGSMSTTRLGHTLTLLPNGKVLVAGGRNESNFLSGAEIYDPISGKWRITGSMTTNREAHTATLLTNGKVLVVGGRSGSFTNFESLANAELFDPASGAWTATGPMTTPRNGHTATLLPNGKVLVAGGLDEGGSLLTGSAGMTLSSAELYDPVTGSWKNTGSMSTYRDRHTANLLPGGKVLVASGAGYSTNIELYDQTTGKWTLTGATMAERQFQTTTLLPNGKLLVAGGIYPGGGYSYTSAELYDVGLGYTNTAQPQITSLTTPLNLGGSLVVTGTQFRGIAEGSSGNSQDSSSDYPLMQLRSLESGQTVFLCSTNWGTNSFASLPVWNFPPGYALATVFVNGIQSTSSIVNISVPIPTAPALTGPVIQTNNAFSFTFTNSVGALFGVRATTNLFMPQTNWTALGGVTEITPGQFQFSDPQTTNNPQRFYQIYSP